MGMSLTFSKDPKPNQPFVATLVIEGEGIGHAPLAVVGDNYSIGCISKSDAIVFDQNTRRIESVDVHANYRAQIEFVSTTGFLGSGTFNIGCIRLGDLHMIEEFEVVVSPIVADTTAASTDSTAAETKLEVSDTASTEKKKSVESEIEPVAQKTTPRYSFNSTRVGLMVGFASLLIASIFLISPLVMKRPKLVAKQVATHAPMQNPIVEPDDAIQSNDAGSNQENMGCAMNADVCTASDAHATAVPTPTPQPQEHIQAPSTDDPEEHAPSGSAREWKIKL